MVNTYSVPFEIHFDGNVLFHGFDVAGLYQRITVARETNFAVVLNMNVPYVIYSFIAQK